MKQCCRAYNRRDIAKLVWVMFPPSFVLFRVNFDFIMGVVGVSIIAKYPRFKAAVVLHVSDETFKFVETPIHLILMRAE